MGNSSSSQVSSFFVSLNRPDNLYFGGETINGVIIMNAKHDFKIDMIKVSLKAYVSFYEIKTTITSEITYKNFITKRVFERKLLIRNNTNDISIKKGRNEWNFELQLPCNLPPSFEAEDFPRLCYNLHVSLVKDIFSTDHLTSVPIHVIPIMKPYGVDEFDVPVIRSVKHGKLLIRCIASKSHYTIPESVHFMIIIKNPERTELVKLTSQFYQDISVGDSAQHRLIQEAVFNEEIKYKVDKKYVLRRDFTVPGFYTQPTQKMALKQLDGISIEVEYFILTTLIFEEKHSMECTLPIVLVNSQKHAENFTKS